ncbi:Reverse transcriptase (RNA-dependent DNA polymerase) [Fragilaria crotonensis]|nr:Reverse transcriptase (RNA-dependent DNA polymerase) [Fragilaria crotonensis]
MTKKSEAHEGLSLLFQREGVPNTIIMDGAREQTMSLFRRKCREAGVHVRQTEPHTPWSNAAESAIRELKKGVGRQMVRSGAPKRLWDDCLEREAYVRSFTAHDIYRLNGQVPETLVSGETADISPLALFKWYEWVLFRDTSVTYPDDSMVLGRDLGPAIDIGPAMTRKVLKSNGQVVYRSTVRALTADELADETMTKNRREFTEKVNAILGDGFKYEDFASDPELETFETPTYQHYSDDGDGELTPHVLDADDDVDVDTHDQYVGAEVNLPIGDRMMSGKNMYAMCDTEGNQYLLLAGIVDHRKDDSAIERPDMYIQRGSNQQIRKTTKGWRLCVEWRDGSTSWERLADLKESNPVEVADYAVSKGIDTEPAFAWWVPFTLKRRNRIIAAVNSRYHKRTHKFGIGSRRLLTTASESTMETATRCGRMRNSLPSCVRCEDGGLPAEGAPCRWGHMTETPASVTYASVVSRESVRIALTLAALNDLEVKTADIENAYLTAPVGEKIWCRLGPEFGADAGRRL